jgi:glycosyltransferase involved in cell wall biosynthesis
MRILINAISSATGGGQTVLSAILHGIAAGTSTHEFFLIAPLKSTDDFENASYWKLLPTTAKGVLSFNFFHIRDICLQHKIDAILNLSDIPTLSQTPEFYFFDWAYACYPESAVWRMMPLMESLYRRTKLLLLSKTINRPRTVGVQIPSMAERLTQLYGIKNTVICSMPVDLSLVSRANTSILPSLRNNPDQRLLFYPASFTPHKNHACLVDVATEIKRRGIDVRILLSLDESGSPSARRFMDSIKNKGLDSVLINLGPLTRKQVFELYKVTDALIMPTLLESFGLPLAEAMASSSTVLVSDFPFTRDVCGNAAYYFDPLNAMSIVDTIEKAFTCETERQSRVELGKSRASSLPSATDFLSTITNSIAQFI